MVELRRMVLSSALPAPWSAPIRPPQHAINVPSTEKCALDNSHLTRDCAKNAAQHSAAIAPSSSRLRFFEKVESGSSTTKRARGEQPSRGRGGRYGPNAAEPGC
jgi:hypothetical protein